MSAVIGTVFLILFLIALALVIVLLLNYNKLQRLAVSIKESYSNAMISSRKRVQLTNRLIDIVKNYGEHEKLTHIAVSENLVNLSAAAQTINQTGDALNHIRAIATQFPELLANESYKRLMDQVQEIEGEFQYKLEAYNSCVKQYNVLRTSIPVVFISQKLGFKEAPFIDIDDTAEIKDFHTDDGELLKAVFAKTGVKIANTSRQVSKSIASAGKKAIDKAKDSLDTVDPLDISVDPGSDQPKPPSLPPDGDDGNKPS